MSENVEKDANKTDVLATEVKEFISNTKKKKRSVSRRKKRNSEEQMIAFVGFILMAIIYIVVGSVACKVSLVTVCCIALMEVIVAKCFYNLPILIHLLVVIIEIIAGAFTGQVLFTILAALVYFVAVVELCYLHRT